MGEIVEKRALRTLRREARIALRVAEGLEAAGAAGAAEARVRAEELQKAVVVAVRERTGREEGERWMVGKLPVVEVKGVKGEGEGRRVAAVSERRAYYPVAALMGEPEGLGEAELARVVCVAAATGSESDPDPMGAGVEKYLAAVFPGLRADERVRGARYLAVLAGEELRPSEGRGAATDCALRAAGLPYAAFEAMRKKDVRFREGCELVEAARRRAVMSMLEEEMIERAFNGTPKEVVMPAGDVVRTMVHDNKLGLELLKHNHEQWVGVRGGGKGSIGKGDADGSDVMQWVVASAGGAAAGAAAGALAAKGAGGEVGSKRAEVIDA